MAYLYQEKGHLADALRMNLQVRADAPRVRFRDTQMARELELLGFTAAADARYAKIFQLDPDNVFSNIAWPRALFTQGRFDEARGALATALSRHTPHVDLLVMQGELALKNGDRSAAALAFGNAALLRPEASLPHTLVGLYGERAESVAWIDRRIADFDADARQGQPWPGSTLDLAILEMARGNRGAAVAAVGRAIDAGYRDRAYLQVSPLFAPLAGDADFARQLARITDDVARQRQQVQAAAWKPADVPADAR